MKRHVTILILAVLMFMAACSITGTPTPVPQIRPTDPQKEAPEPTDAPGPKETPVVEEPEPDQGTSITDPSTLIGTWHGDSGGWMVLRQDGSFRGAFNERELFNTKPGDNAFWNGTYRFEDGQIRFEESSHRCDAGIVGAYQAYQLEDGSVRYELVSDECDMRINTLLGQRVEPVIEVLWEKTSDEAPYAMGWFRSIQLPFIPHDIAAAVDGSLYAVELGAPIVHKLDSEGNPLASWGGAGSEASQFAFDPPPDGPPLDGGFLVVGPNGNVYVSDSYNHRVQVFDSEGDFLAIWERYGPEDTPFDSLGPISADDQGNIYVADFSGVHQFDAEGVYLQTLQAAGEVAIDSQGNLYTTVAFEGIALKLPAGGGEPQIWGSAGMENGQFETPMWVVVGPDDTVYIADHSGRVQQFDSQGNFMAVWSDPSNGDGPLTGPAPLAQDTEGNIYVAAKDRTTVYVLRP